MAAGQQSVSEATVTGPQKLHSTMVKQSNSQVVSDPRLKKIEKSLGITKKVEKINGAATQLKGN